MTPRVGFLGVGWIGRQRMEALVASGVVQPAAVCDADPAAAAEAARAAGAPVVEEGDLLDPALALAGLVVATPSALHAAQAAAALRAGLAVFCQKPLGRSAEECRTVVDAAREAGRLLAVDLSYRHTEAVRRMEEVVASGALGTVYAADLCFHNAYGPDKAWYRDPARSGGGCVVDLGIHLVDLALRLTGAAKAEHVDARLYRAGAPWRPGEPGVEDFASARIDLSTGALVTLSCSWFLHAGCDAVIRAAFHGTDGAVELRNVGGSFYDFEAFHHSGTASRVLASPPDAWGGRAAVDWARRLSAGEGFDPAVEQVVEVARVLDAMYGG